MTASQGTGPAAGAVVFSPHLDDAALSAAHRVLAGDASVVTVFGAPPPESLVLGEYDRMGRARTSAERFAERLREDDAALAILGAPGGGATRLPLRDDQYRTEVLDLRALRIAVEPFTEAAELWIPAAVGSHPDHRAVRDTVLAICPDGAEVYLYADLPYSMRFGWPAWVTGIPDGPYLDLAYWLEREVAACGLDQERLEPVVFRLEGGARERKAEAALCYRTQLPFLRLSPDEPSKWSQFTGFEVAWRFRR